MPDWVPLPDFQVSLDVAGTRVKQSVVLWYLVSIVATPFYCIQVTVPHCCAGIFIYFLFIWGPQWTSKRFQFLFDNKLVVAVLSWI